MPWCAHHALQVLDTSDHVEIEDVMERLREEYAATAEEDFPIVRVG